MNNTFNKLIVDANCKALNSEFSKITHHTQNGFVGGRIVLKNPVDIDASGRIYSCAYEGRRSCSLQGAEFGKNGGDLAQRTSLSRHLEVQKNDPLFSGLPRPPQALQSG